MTNKKEEGGAIVLGLLILIAVSIKVSQGLFPYFLIGSLIGIILLLGFGIWELFFRDTSYLGIWEYFSTYIGLFFLFCLIGTGITYVIGYGLGGTSIGEASIQVYDSLNEVEEQFDNSINLVIEDSCKTLDEKSCLILRQNYNNFKTIQEVTDMTKKLKKTAVIVDKISK